MRIYKMTEPLYLTIRKKRSMRNPQNLSFSKLPDDDLKGAIIYKDILGTNVVNNFRFEDYYVFVLLEKCSGTHIIDFQEYVHKNLQLHISFPGQVHSWNTDNATIGQKVYISRKVMDSYALFKTPFSQGQSNTHPVIDLSREVFDKLKFEFDLIKRDLTADPFMAIRSIILIRAHIIVLMISDLLYKKAGEEKRFERINQVVLNFESHIETCYKAEKSVQYYAEKLSVTPNYLNILSRKYFKLSAKEVIMRRVFFQAKRLLGGTNMSIKEIAFELGFSDQTHFNNFIRTVTGVTPKAFRQSISFVLK